MTESVTVVSKRRNEIGEGPHWDPKTRNLFFVDIPQGVVGKLNTETQEEVIVELEGGTVSFVLPYENDSNQLIISRNNQILKLRWDTKELAALAQVEPEGLTRLNDAKCDARGRIWAGTMGLESSTGIIDEGLGSLYSMDSNSCVVEHLSGITISNGLDWTHDDRTMYFVDSWPPRQVYAFDFDVDAGTISKQRVVKDFNKDPCLANAGNPDGMTIDVEGKLWVCCFGGSRVLRIDPVTGTVLRTVDLPAKYITSCCFGGQNYEDLYVTSGYYNLTEQQKSELPGSGAIFRISGLGAKGEAANCSVK